MSSEFFTWEIDELGIGQLTLDRPEIHNAFNDKMIADLTTHFSKENVDSYIKNGCRVILVKGNGKSFCAGADLNWMKAMKNYTMEENVQDSLKLQNMFTTIDQCHLPTIGVVHGAALGGGSGLVSCFDYVIADENTKFGFTEVKLGLLPAVISPYVMAKIGYSQARALFTTGERFMAQKALEIGLIHRVESNETLNERVKKVIGQFLSAGPEASCVAKILANQVNDSNKTFDEKQKFTRELIAETRIKDEAQEGMSAMLDKRKPNWVK